MDAMAGEFTANENNLNDGLTLTASGILTYMINVKWPHSGYSVCQRILGS